MSNGILYTCGKCKHHAYGFGTLLPPEGWREFQASDGKKYSLCRDCRQLMIEDLLLDKIAPRLSACETLQQVIMDVLQTEPEEKPTDVPTA